MEVERIWQPLLNSITIGLFSFDTVHAAILHRSSGWLQTKRACHWIVGDLWRENILVMDDRITGIVDFGAARVDWPVLEVVRWLSSWLGPDDERLPGLLAEYASLRMVASKRQDKSQGDLEDEFLAPNDFCYLDKLCCLSAFLEWLNGVLEDRFELVWLERKVLPRVTELAARLISLQC